MPYNFALKRALIEAGLRQGKAAKRAGINEGRFSQIVTGLANPTPKEQAAIARVLKLSIDQLFGSGVSA